VSKRQDAGRVKIEGQRRLQEPIGNIPPAAAEAAYYAMMQTQAAGDNSAD